TAGRADRRRLPRDVWLPIPRWGTDSRRRRGIERRLLRGPTEAVGAIRLTRAAPGPRARWDTRIDNRFVQRALGARRRARWNGVARGGASTCVADALPAAGVSRRAGWRSARRR